MPQPSISGTPPTLTFGGLAMANGQGTMASLNLNDLANWTWMAWPGSPALADGDFRVPVTGHLAWRAKGAYLGQDTKPRVLTLPMRFREINRVVGVDLGKMAPEVAGTQYLSFDGLTAVQCRFNGEKRRQLLLKFQPYYWALDLEFVATTPWWQDLTPTSISSATIVSAPTAAPSGAVAAGGALATGTYTLQYTYVTASGETAPSPLSSGIVLTTGNQQISVSAVTPLPSWATAVKWYFGAGSPTTGFTVQNNGAAFTLNTAGNGTAAPSSTPATQFSVTYAGSVFAEPVWTFTVPNTNTAPIQSFALANTMSGETLTITFPGNLAASTTWTITIDSGAFSVADQNGHSYDVAGSFPNLYPPAGQVNTLTAAVTAASGVPVGCTIAGSMTNRWVL